MNWGAIESSEAISHIHSLPQFVVKTVRCKDSQTSRRLEMVIQSLIMPILIFWGVLALWPALRGRLKTQPAPVPARANRRPGGATW